MHRHQVVEVIHFPVPRYSDLHKTNDHQACRISSFLRPPVSSLEPLNRRRWNTPAILRLTKWHYDGIFCWYSCCTLFIPFRQCCIDFQSFTFEAKWTLRLRDSLNERTWYTMLFGEMKLTRNSFSLPQKDSLGRDCYITCN
jgi:hypothetical protein